MPIIAVESGGTFTPAPAGVHQGICVDVVDLGKIKTEYDGKSRETHKIRIVWEIDEQRDDGQRFTVGRRYTLSLNEKASLRKDLESWRSRTFTPEELKGFDLEKLLGVNCMLNIVHETRDGKTWANVASIMPLAKGMQKAVPSGGYVREKDRSPEQRQGYVAEGITDDDVPF